MISFRREKHVPLGGPDGGDGGRGGDVLIVAKENLSSLVHLHRHSHFHAENGGHGNSKRRTGANGETMIVFVPPGTVVRNADTGDVLADLTEAGQEALILSGGRGGRGNIRFATSVNRAPRLAERGEPGEEMWLSLELKLIADVGIVGVPNAGKSTLLAAVSGATPKIADYPFTTLQPNLGVVRLDDYETMVLADIPGLIEGAAEGIGLGHDFLRHIERTRVLIHLLDGASNDPLVDWAMINQELAMYDVSLETKPQLVVLNKIDLPDAQAWDPLISERMAAEGVPYCAISAVTGMGVREMLFQAKGLLDATPLPPPAADKEVVIRPEENDGFSIERVGDGWRIRGTQIERVAAMTYFEFDATLVRFQHILERMGITEAMEEAGVEPGDTVYIGDEELEWGV